jgi:serralysin
MVTLINFKLHFMKLIFKLFVFALSILVSTNLIAQKKKEIKRLGCGTEDPNNSFALDTTNPTRGMADNNFLWDNGKTINVKILSGSNSMKLKVQKWASEWMKYANIKFKFVNDGPAQIRVYMGDKKGGYGHVTMGLGIRCLQRNENDFTMHFDTTDLINDRSFRGTVLHEFGHALGLIHEHMSPVSGIQWDSTQVYGRKKLGGWDKNMTDAQLFKKYNQSYTNGTVYDPKSIMHYPISRWETKNRYHVDWNYDLSEGDKALIAALYPKGVRKNKVPRITISDVGETVIEYNQQKDGISIYPSFNITCSDKEASLNYISLLVDENDYFLPTQSRNYQINNMAGSVKSIKLPINKLEHVNTKTRNFEIFIPSTELPTTSKGKYLKVYFRVFLNTADEQKQILGSLSSKSAMLPNN